jgi:hypothetical protein
MAEADAKGERREGQGNGVLKNFGDAIYLERFRLNVTG